MCCADDEKQPQDHARIWDGQGILSPTMEGMLCYVARSKPTPTHEDMVEMIRRLIDHRHTKPREVNRLIDAGYSSFGTSGLMRPRRRPRPPINMLGRRTLRGSLAEARCNTTEARRRSTAAP